MNAQARGWGAPCTQPRRTVTFSNGTRVTVATGIADLVEMLGNETLRRGYVIRSGVTGGYNCRKISGSTSWSNHAWALAIDINWDRNPMGSSLVTDMPSWMPPLWESYGFRWGGRYQRRPDAMHFEFMGTPNDAVQQTEKAIAAFRTFPPFRPYKRKWSLWPFADKRTIRRGSNGGEVKYLCGVLRAVRQDFPNNPNRIPAPGKIDGKFDVQLRKAVRQYQRNKGLQDDGVVGPKTWRKIDATAKRRAEAS